MSAQDMIVNEIDTDEKWLYRLGSISAFVFGISYLIIIALYISAGGPPSGSDVEARLVYLAEHSKAWWGILGFSVLTDILYIPIALALYLALKKMSKNMMLVAIACIGLFVILELGITWLNYAALLRLSDSYVAAASEAQKMVIVTAAHYPYAVLDSHNLLGVYTVLMNGIGVFIVGLVMLKGVFNKTTAYLALVSSSLTVIAIVGTPFVSALWATMIIGSLLIGVWVFFVSYRLYQITQLGE